MKHYINASKVIRIEAQNGTQEHQPRVIIDLEGDSFAVVKFESWQHANHFAERLGMKLNLLEL
jgi:hypothetical protein